MERNIKMSEKVIISISLSYKYFIQLGVNNVT